MQEVLLKTTDNKEEFVVGMIDEDWEMGTYGETKYLVPLYDERAIDYLAGQIRGYINHGATCNILITGMVRTGKSTLGLKISRKVSERFCLDDVVWWPEEFEKRIHFHPYADPKNGHYPIALWDESILGLMAHRWYEQQSLSIAQELEVIAKKGIACLFIVPHKAKLMKTVREEMIHLWLHCYLFEDFQRGYAEVRMPQENIFIEQRFWKPWFALKFSPFADDDPFWVEYEKKKMGNIESVTLGKHKRGIGAGNRAQSWKEQRDKLVRYIYQNAKELGLRKVSQRDIAEIAQIDQSTIVDILNGQ